MKQKLLCVIALLIIFTSNASGQGNPCVGSQTLTASPPPDTNGFYFNGTVVTFCATVTDYLQLSAEWFAALVPVFGPGWDLSTLTPVSAANSCDGQGNWGWYPSCTSTQTGNVFGPGFYYDSPAGSPGGMLDGIPGNNFGDNCTVNTWTFCWSVQVAPNNVAPGGTNLSVSAYVYGDNAAGSWGGAGCSDTAAPAIQTATVFPNCSLFVPSVSITNASCTNTTDGSITVVPSGVAPYTYLWSTGDTTATITNLAPGIYTITVTDSTTCSKVVTIPVDGPDPIVSNATVVPNGCDPSGGSITLAPTGGNGAPFTYMWNTGANTSTLSNLAGGTYIVTITDSLNCSQTDTFLLNTTVPITLTGSSTLATCLGNDGTATVTAGGGQPPFTYLWSTGDLTATAGNLAPGTYTVTVFDSQGCTSQTTVLVGSVPGVTLTAGADTSVCAGQSATLTATPSGGLGPFTYLWDNLGATATITVNPATTTTYMVTVTDANSCTATAQVTVTAIDYPVVTVSPDADICFGTGTQLSASGGTTYQWAPATGLNDPTLANPFASPSVSTTYTVIAANGPCTALGMVNVVVEPEIIGGFNADTTHGQAPLTVNFNNSSSGANAYQWNFGDGNSSSAPSPTHVYTSQGNYTVVLIASNNLGCADTVSFNYIIVEELSSLVIPNVFTPNGDGFNDLFEFEEMGIASIDVKILNRWGNEVYSWSKLDAGWDGKSSGGEQLPEGPYMYIIKARGINGKNYDYQGTVQLIRGSK